MLLLKGHTLLYVLSAAAAGYPYRHGGMARCYDGIKERKREMKKRILAVILCLAMLGAAGCGGNSAKETDKEAKSGTEEKGKEDEKEGSESKGEEYVAWIKEAWEDYKASELRGFVESKFEGSQWEVNTIDSGKQQWMIWSYSSDSGSEEPLYTYIWTKEGDNDYTFKRRQTGENTFEYLKVLIDPDKPNTESYSGYIEEEELPFEDTEETEVVSVSAVQEGEEDINGVNAVKIEVTYETKLKSAKKLTRESVMSQNGWTEEAFNALSDFRLNELLDTYVAYVNSFQEGKMKESATEKTVYYLSGDGHKLLRKIDIASDVSGYPQRVTEEIGGLMRALKANLEYNTLEESVQELKESRGEYWDYEGLMESMADELSSTSYIEITTDYQTGDECQAIELPAEAKEITQEQYDDHNY